MQKVPCGKYNYTLINKCFSTWKICMHIKNGVKEEVRGSKHKETENRKQKTLVLNEPS